MYKRCILAAMAERTNIRLDDQARTDAQAVARRYNLGSTAAAVRFALRELARRIEVEEKATQKDG